MTSEAVETAFTTSRHTGLPASSIADRQRSHGKNTLTAHELTWRHILLRQFTSSFVYLLLGAVILATLLREFLDAGMILLFIFINAGLGFYQEFRSEQTAKLLKRYLKQDIHVKRSGNITVVENTEIVAGDIVLLAAGDKVPADMRLLEATDLLVNESSLTGESVPIRKHTNPIKKGCHSIAGADNMAFSGTTVAGGTAIGVVVATGNNTVFGGISTLATDTVRVSNFAKGINEFSRFILRLVGGTIMSVFILHTIFNRDSIGIGDLAIFSIALAVGVIPEALPLVTTFSLSRGALRLTKHHVVVKRLSAIEDLGSIEVLCSDKTGTLTENVMTVDAIWGPHKNDVLRMAALGADVYDTKAGETGNPFDRAILAVVPKAVQEEIAKSRLIKEIPFDSERRRNSTLIDTGRERRLIVRGAPEVIAPYAHNVNKKTLDTIYTWAAREGKRGRRVIAIADRAWTKDTYHVKDEVASLTFIGCISFLDPIKKTTKRAVEDAKHLGVALKILTGDSPTVAGAVAYEVGIIASPDDVMTSEQFMMLSPAEQAAAADKHAVFARLAPEQKFLLIQILQKKHEVGFMGEGINDAPALKVANVGMVVQGASHVAQEASDIILLGKSLHVIIDGIKEGREIFANTIKYIKITLISNFGNFYALAFASFLIPHLPMLPLQLLLVNLLSDFPMISVATDTVDRSELRSPRGYDVRSITLLATLLGLVSTMFDFIFFGLFKNMSPSILQTNWFIGSILTELAVIYSIRTRGWFFRGQRPGSILVLLTVLAGIATAIIPFTPIGERLFRFTPPSHHHLLLIFFIVLGYFVTTEAVKRLYYRHINHESRP